MTVESTEDRVHRLYEEWLTATLELRAERIAAAEFGVGDVVEISFTNGRQWEPGIVREVMPQSWRTWYRVSRRKKDGKWSTQIRHAFENVRAAPKPGLPII